MPLQRCTPPPLLAIVDSSVDVAEVLVCAAADEGYRAVTACARAFRSGDRDLAAFLREHDPTVVLWDIALPYEDNWRYVQAVRARDIMADCPLVLTTTNKRALDSLVGPTEVIEIVGKPFDLGEVFAAVRRAERGERVGTTSPRS